MGLDRAVVGALRVHAAAAVTCRVHIHIAGTLQACTLHASDAVLIRHDKNEGVPADRRRGLSALFDSTRKRIIVGKNTVGMSPIFH